MTLFLIWLVGAVVGLVAVGVAIGYDVFHSERDRFDAAGAAVGWPITLAILGPVVFVALVSRATQWLRIRYSRK